MLWHRQHQRRLRQPRGAGRQRRRKRCATSWTSCGKSSSPCATRTAPGSRRSKKNSRRWVCLPPRCLPLPAPAPRSQRPAGPADAGSRTAGRRAGSSRCGGAGWPDRVATGLQQCRRDVENLQPRHRRDRKLRRGWRHELDQPDARVRAGRSRGDVPGSRRSLRARRLLPFVLTGGRRDRRGFPDADVASGRAAGKGRQAQGAGWQGEHAPLPFAALGRQAVDGAKPFRRRGRHRGFRRLGLEADPQSDHVPRGNRRGLCRHVGSLQVSRAQRRQLGRPAARLSRRHRVDEHRRRRVRSRTARTTPGPTSRRA